MSETVSSAMQGINRAWLEKRPEDLAPLFDADHMTRDFLAMSLPPGIPDSKTARSQSAQADVVLQKNCTGDGRRQQRDHSGIDRE